MRGKEEREGGDLLVRANDCPPFNGDQENNNISMYI